MKLALSECGVGFEDWSPRSRKGHSMEGKDGEDAMIGADCFRWSSTFGDDTVV